MINVTAIVEGYGDVAAVPQLLVLAGALIGSPNVAKNPIRAGEWKQLRGNGVLERYLSLAASRVTDQILVLLDLEDDCCAKEYAGAIQRIAVWDNGRGISVGVAFFVREYETLFLACADLQSQYIGWNGECGVGSRRKRTIATSFGEKIQRNTGPVSTDEAAQSCAANLSFPAVPKDSKRSHGSQL